MQKSAQDLMEKIGIKELFAVPHGKLQGSTVLATNGKENLTVSQMLKSAEYLIKFIKDNFDVDEERYSITIIFLKSVQLMLNNGSADKPTKEDAHIIIDVMHELLIVMRQGERVLERKETILQISAGN
ncbi:hypothetical protein AALB53_03785 [Lachnospiraceae bacterium 47-T17]